MDSNFIYGLSTEELSSLLTLLRGKLAEFCSTYGYDFDLWPSYAVKQYNLYCSCLKKLEDNIKVL